MAAPVYPKHFPRHEFLCRHCGKEGPMSQALLDGLEALRVRTGPLQVTSGYRCPLHPVEHAKAPTAKLRAHVDGLAADIHSSTLGALELYKIAKQMDVFKGFGVDEESNYLHVDVRPWAEVAKWSYSKGRVVRWKHGDL